MNSVNHIVLLGTTGKDPDLRTTGGGMSVATFSVATSESRKDAQGNWKDETTWHSVKTFGRQADLARDKVKKGSHVLIEGRLTNESWDDKQTGQKRSKAVIVANHLSVVSGAKATPKPNNAALEITDADIPF